MLNSEEALDALKIKLLLGSSSDSLCVVIPEKLERLHHSLSLLFSIAFKLCGCGTSRSVSRSSRQVWRKRMALPLGKKMGLFWCGRMGR